MRLQQDFQSKRCDKPNHIAIVMDGNGRWAKARNKPRAYGHQQGMLAAKEVVKSAIKHEIPYLTLFAFSSENWSRPNNEVKWLMRLLKRAIEQEVNSLQAQGVKCIFIGRTDRLDKELVELMQRVEQQTMKNKTLTLQIALDYGGRWDILQAMGTLAEKVSLGNLKPNHITEDMIAAALATKETPDPDLIVRTGGEHRLSNFLLWQSAYAEYCFSECYWPEFDEEEFVRCLRIFAGRQRRYGLIDETQETEHA